MRDRLQIKVKDILIFCGKKKEHISCGSSHSYSVITKRNFYLSISMLFMIHSVPMKVKKVSVNKVDKIPWKISSTWADVDPDLWSFVAMASLGHNELTHLGLVTHICFVKNISLVMHIHVCIENLSISLRAPYQGETKLRWVSARKT